MYKYVVIDADCGEVAQEVNCESTMMFKENRYRLNQSDSMMMVALPPVHSLRLMIVAIPTEKFTPGEFVEL